VSNFIHATDVEECAEFFKWYYGYPYAKQDHELYCDLAYNPGYIPQNWDHSYIAMMIDSDRSELLERCRQGAHVLRDCSTATPESGNMDVVCEVCGEYWSRPLY